MEEPDVDNITLDMLMGDDGVRNSPILERNSTQIDVTEIPAALERSKEQDNLDTDTERRIDFDLNRGQTLGFLLGEKPVDVKQGEENIIGQDDGLKRRGNCVIAMARHGTPLQRFDTLSETFSDALVDVIKDKSQFWLDVLAPSQSVLTVLSDIFKLHPLTAEDAGSLYTREKCEVFDEYLFLALQARDRRDDRAPISTCTVYVAIFDSFVITFHPFEVQEISCGLDVVESGAGNTVVCDVKDLTSWVPLYILSAIGDSFRDISDSIRSETDTISELILYVSTAERSDVLARINQAARCVAKLMRKMQPKRAMLHILTTRHFKHMSDETRLFLRDALDDCIEIISQMQGGRENLNQSHAHYNAAITIEMTEASNAMNQTMKMLSAGGAVFIPLTLIASLWGMNVRVPGQSGVESIAPFVIICVTMLILGPSIFYLIRRMSK